MRRTGTVVPDFEFKLLNGGTWSSRDAVAVKFTLLTIYRGMWCGHCKKQLQELDGLVDDFQDRGVSIVAVSADTEDRARQMATDYALENLNLGYEAPIDAAREMGVFVSSRVKDIEMPFFCEPASLLIDQNSKLFAAWIASCAFARTAPADILAYIDFIAGHSDRPPRGSA